MTKVRNLKNKISLTVLKMMDGHKDVHYKEISAYTY
jgi:hypothetical protein